MHDHPTTRKDIALYRPADNDRFGFDLRLNLSSWVDHESVIGENLATKMAADPNGPFESQASVETGASFK
jgi:hypothetical protein